jgi:hypothetical protein
MTDQLEELSKTLKCFIQQAESNCFIKSHEPGFAIRSNDCNISQKIITIMGCYAMKLIEKDHLIDLVQKRNELELALRHYWEKEATISKYVFGQIVLSKVRVSKNFHRKFFVEEHFIECIGRM